MYMGLIANFDHAAQWLIESGAHSANYRILGFVGKVGRVKIGEVEIFDPVVERATGQVVEHRLVNCAGKHEPVRKVEAAYNREHTHQGRRRAYNPG
jgi:hypothetical protein